MVRAFFATEMYDFSLSEKHILIRAGVLVCSGGCAENKSYDPHRRYDKMSNENRPALFNAVWFMRFSEKNIPSKL